MTENIHEKKMSSEKDKTKDKSHSEIWTSQERELLKSKYGCEILKHNCTLEEARDTNVPTDAYIVTYVSSGKTYYDLTRCGKKVNLFDMYYDVMGDVVRNIDWGCGKFNPKTWDYKAPEKKKRK
jgi:hypothetical protein